MLKIVNAALKVRGQCQGQGQKTWPLDASRPRAGLEDYITARHSPHSSVKMRINPRLAPAMFLVACVRLSVNRIMGKRKNSSIYRDTEIVQI